jgi:hypothetical protein
MSFQMQVPFQGVVEETAPTTHRRRRRVKKIVNTTNQILEQPTTLPENIITPTTSVRPPPISISRTAVNLETNSEEFTDIIHIIHDHRITVKRIKLIGSTEGIAGIRMIHLETGEEIYSDTIESDEISVIELVDFPQKLDDTVVLQINPGGFEVNIQQVEVWTEIANE